MKTKLFNNSNYFLEVSKEISNLASQVPMIDKISQIIFEANSLNKKILVAGNGGSCADAEHFVGELVCTFLDRNRGALSAINLSSNISAMTAWANDFNFESFIARQVEAHGKEGDILFLITTGGGNEDSGASMNLVRACEKANSMKIKTISLVGKDGGILKKLSDDYILIPSKKTSVIQECHMSILHAICNNLDILMQK